MRNRQILLLRRFAAAQMAFRLVDLQHALNRLIQRAVFVHQLFCDVFMYCTLADFEFFCRGAHRGAGFDNIFAEDYAPLSV